MFLHNRESDRDAFSANFVEMLLPGLTFFFSNEESDRDAFSANFVEML